ncbi:thiamine phosphate synthase [Sphingobacterium oryzagri]|uniref:Thiamine phosphate synthase n=1 Tax=Sphingobacterium oryzagri TaxID=3025669 RepID=A0ABY7WCI5_9SPHI|nr:thiamine phosphate synthase [Sphingobacterium sp. KACC 22765]WDF67372.1 thiamine phosphate synthase [Sphingobacterium sp. KACC 22765]
MSLSKLQYITSGSEPAQHYEQSCKALDCGINWIQLRIKHGREATILSIAEKIMQRKANYDFTLVINDHPHIAKSIDADGVHLGLADTSIAEARQILGPDKLVGGTANTLAHVLQRAEERCDYIGLGPLRYTQTKEKLSPILGFSGYAAIFEQLKDLDNIPPIFAIGGILHSDIAALTRMGIYGVALSKSLQDNFDQPAAIQQITSAL